jgi:glycosyltransferase involved in cell wall biosynthesis
MKENLKIVLICHFSTEKVRNQLPLDNRKLYSLVRKLLRMPVKNAGYGDIAPWTSDLITKLSERNKIELHVISAHTGLKRMLYSFSSNNVHYYFVKADFSTLLKRIIPNDSLWRKLNPMRFVVRKVVKNISPDIVNLIGAENAYISGTILDIKDYPIFVLCQTIYNNPNRSKFGIVDSKNASTEMLIFQKENYFGVYSRMHYDLLLQHKPDAFIFDFQWPSGKLPEVTLVEEKKYDFINFAASLSFNKGFHDSILALAIVKKKYPNVVLNLVGGGDSQIRQELERLVEENDLNDNVFFTPFFEKKEDLFQHLQNSRFAVLPCKMDVTSGTMSQSMYYKLPLVVYKTTGTPKFNINKECVLIAEMNNIEDLAEKMLFLMDNPEKAKQMSENAHEYILKSKDNNKIMERLISDYHAIIDHHYNQTPIPKELLFDTDNYPIYS